MGTLVRNKAHSIDADDALIIDHAYLATLNKFDIAQGGNAVWTDIKSDYIAFKTAAIFGDSHDVERLTLLIDGIGRDIEAFLTNAGARVYPRPTLCVVADVLVTGFAHNRGPPRPSQREGGFYSGQGVKM